MEVRRINGLILSKIYQLLIKVVFFRNFNFYNNLLFNLTGFIFYLFTGLLFTKP
jgi:hypothetical protein